MVPASYFSMAVPYSLCEQHAIWIYLGSMPVLDLKPVKLS